MRMRTQSEAIRAIREVDPGTCLTPYALRQLILSGRVPSVKIGKKYLIDLDTLDEHLTAATPPQTVTAGRIRSVV